MNISLREDSSSNNLFEAIHRDGYIVLHNLSIIDPVAVLHRIISSISKPINYYDQPMAMEVRPRPGFLPASSGGTGEFGLHTDLSFHPIPPRYLAMICIHPGEMDSGLPLLTDGVTAIKRLDVKDKDFLLRHKFSFRKPAHIEGPPHIDTVLKLEDEQFHIRFRADLLAEGIPLPFMKLKDYIQEEAHIVPMNTGSLYIVDNHRMLHGRTEIKEGLESNRHYVRMYGV